MRIAVWHNLPSGGGKRALYNHIRALKERGHYLEAWTSDLSAKDYLPLTDLVTEHILPVKDIISESYKYTNPIKRIQKQIASLKDQERACVNEIEAQNFDLIFANSCLFSYMPYLSNFSKIPSVVYLGEPYRLLYESFPENIWQAPSYDFKIKNAWRIVNEFKDNYAKRIQTREEINAAKKYNSILVNSLFSRENVLRSYGLDSKVCYLGIDINVFKPVDYRKEPYIVGLGKISHLKSVHKAIGIISKIPPEFRPELKWISNGYDEAYFNEMVLLSKQLKVKFEPLINIPDTEVVRVLSLAAIMIYLPYLEPFGLAPLEANACGTYVVAIAEGGIRESICEGRNGHLLIDYNEDELSGVILKFVTDLNYASLKGEEALLWVKEKWDWESMADNIEHALSGVLKK